MNTQTTRASGIGRQAGRVWPWVLAAFLAIVVLLGVATWWAVRWVFESPGAAERIVREIVPRVPGLQVESPGGSFATGLSAGRLSWENEDLRLEIVGPRLEWSREAAIALAGRLVDRGAAGVPELRLESAAATRIAITNKRTGNATAAGGASKPFSLPLALDVRRLQVGELVYVDGATRVSARDVSGGAASGLDAASATWTDGDTRVDVTTAKIAWTEDAYAALMRQLAAPGPSPPSLVLQSVSLGRVSVKGGSAPSKPRTLPESLKLPLTIDVPSITIGEIDVAAGGPPITVRSVAGELKSDGSTHRVAVSMLRHASGELAGELAVGAERPFALAGRFDVRGKASDVGLAVRAQVAGSLERPTLDGTLVAERGKSEASGAFSAELSPFAPLPLRRLKASTRRLDLAAWNADWPRTLLDVEAEASMRGESELAGRLAARNAAPGPLDASRVPLRTLAGTFVATPARFELAAASARTTNGSEIRGEARFGERGGELRVATEGVDASEIDSRAKALRVAGSVGLRIAGETLRIDADLRHRGYVLVGEATKKGGRIDVAQARLASPYGSARFAGSLDLDGSRPFDATGELAGFNPADFGDFPQAKLNGRFDARGALDPRPAADVRVELADSTLRGQPLRGSVVATVSEERRFVGEFDLSYAGNRITGKGALGTAGDALRWQVDAPALARVDPRLRGELQASGVVSGSFDAPTIELVSDARGLSYAGSAVAPSNAKAATNAAAGARAGRLHAEGRAEIRQGGAFSIRVDASQLAVSGRDIDSARAEASGTLEQHAIRADATIDGRPMLLRAGGGWQPPGRWDGTVEQLSLQRPAIALQSPVQVRVAGRDVAFGPAVIVAEGARVELARAEWKGGTLRVAGSFRDLALATILAATGDEAKLPSDLRLMGRIDAEVGDDVRGTVEVSRQSGDVALAQVPTVMAGLSDLRISLVAPGGGAVTGTAVARGERIGSVDATLRSRLVRRNGGWSIEAGAPLQGTVSAEIRDLAWINGMLPGDWRLAGRARLQATAAGSLDAPKLDGTVRGDALALQSLELGVDLSSGVLDGRFDGSRLVVQRFDAKGPAGMLTGTGTIVESGGVPRGRIELRADRLRAISRPDRSIVVTGDVAVGVDGSQVKVTGKLRADEARIDLPPAEKPTLGADVVVRTRDEATAVQTSGTSAPGAPRSALAGLDVEFDLGDQFKLKGRGLDTRLAGTLRFTQANGRLQATGAVRAVDGTYLAYGRKLEIERGVVTFAGAIDNPRLDVRALRTRQDVEAGVLVTGTLALPQVQLFSRPDVPDTEKLSWLVLGHGLDKSSRAQAGMLQSAALALLTPAAGANLQTKIAEVFGFDQISFSSGGNELQKGVVTVGKQLTRDLYVSLEQGLAGAESFAKVNFLFTKRWQVTLRSGGGENAADVFYTLKFD